MAAEFVERTAANQARNGWSGPPLVFRTWAGAAGTGPNAGPPAANSGRKPWAGAPPERGRVPGPPAALSGEEPAHSRR